MSQFAQENQVDIWGEVSFGGVELQGWLDAVKSLLTLVPSTQVDTVSLKEGGGIQVSFEPKLLLQSARRGENEVGF